MILLGARKEIKEGREKEKRSERGRSKRTIRLKKGVCIRDRGGGVDKRK